jgi:S1-C subfamily serine protease
MFCGSDAPTHAVAQIEQVANNNVKAAFKIVAREAALPLFEPELSPFEAAAPRSADYLLGGVLERIAIDACVDGQRRKGSVDLEMKWEVYSTKLQRVVLNKTTSGGFKTDDYVTGSLEPKAYQQALQALLQSTEFKAVAAGKLPDGAGTPTWQPLHLRAGAAIAGDAQSHADALAKAVVTIVSDIGSGTGFYIADGYLLTDRHVVGSSKYVKVKLADGRQLVGEVLRQDASRDVALLQTESAGVPSLRVNLVDPPVGATTFAIGSPLGETLAGTFTRGVLSGVRDVDGTRFLQSDVAINHGNSGGPLLDAGSRVVGLAELTIIQTTGLSFFVPVKDALERLNVVIDDGAAGG